MARSAAFLILPTHARNDAVEEVVQTNAQLAAHCVEDLRLAERVEHALGATGYASLRDIDVAAHVRLITLEGCVPSYFLKQIAQAAALSVPGVDEIRNNLEVGSRLNHGCDAYHAMGRLGRHGRG